MPSGSSPSTTTHVWLTRQPREAIGEAASLEVPAGKLDVEDEPPLATAKRELGEEIGKRAGEWQEIACFFTSPGFSDERVWLYLAQELEDDPDAEPIEDERIEIVPWPLTRLDEAIAACRGLQDADRLALARLSARGRGLTGAARRGGLI